MCRASHCPTERVDEAKQEMDTRIIGYADGCPLRGLPNTKLLRPCLKALDADMCKAFGVEHVDNVLSNCCWVISGVWMLVSLDAFQGWPREQFPELFDVMAALTMPVKELKTATTMMQLLARLLLSDPIAAIINSGLSSGTVINDPSEFVDAVLKTVKELEILTTMTRTQTSQRTCGCPGTDERDEQPTIYNIIMVSVGDLLATPCDNKFASNTLWQVSHQEREMCSTKCLEKDCKGGKILRRLGEPDELPEVLLLQLCRGSLDQNDLGGKKSYHPSAEFYLLEGDYGQTTTLYHLKSWTGHGGHKNAHHMCGLMFKDHPAAPTRVYTIDGNTELTLESIGPRELPKYKSAVSFAVYERSSNQQSRLSALIANDIRFMDGLLKIVEKTPKQRTPKPTLNLPVNVRTSSRSRQQTQKYVPDP